jgi:hypothetical protein
MAEPGLTKRPTFRMKKWYFDCVSESGDVLILYASELHWRGIHLHYSALLGRRGGDIETRTSMRRCVPGLGGDGRITLDAPTIGVSGVWRAASSQLEQTLFTSEEGAVHWHCMQPKSHTTVAFGQHSIAGLGYAECLTLTIPPWRLPMRRLQWGRFLSTEEAVIWIDWTGDFSRRWVWRNGEKIEVGTVDEAEICFSAEEGLTLDQGTVLREGRLGTTVLAAAPALRKFFPRAMSGIHERKWLSEGKYVRGTYHSAGWAIHEIVDWIV